MKSIIEIKKINFGSFIKLCLFISLSLGITMGILLFVLSIFGGNVYANIGPIHLTGIMAGIINIVLFPVMMTISGIGLSLIAYLPFKLINTYIFKSIKLKGNFNCIQEDMNDNDNDQLEE